MDLYDSYLPTTPLEFAQFLTNRLVAGYTTKAVLTQITNRTDIDTDRTPVKVGAWATGELVAYNTKSKTDVVVEKTWNFVQTKRFERQIKKNRKNHKKTNEK